MRDGTGRTNLFLVVLTPLGIQVAADHLKRVLAATAEKTGAEDDIDLLAALHKGRSQ